MASDILCQQDGKENTSDISLVEYVQDIRFYSVDLFYWSEQFASLVWMDSFLATLTIGKVFVC